MKCNHCKSDQSCHLLCDKCGDLLQDNPPDNPFDIFHLPCRFNIDEKALEKEYLELSKEVHPDHHRDKSPEVQSKILNICSKINCAYRDLRCPFNRARIILERLAGANFVPDQKQVEPDFLWQILELQEELDQEKIKLKKDVMALQQTEKKLEAELNLLFGNVNKQLNDLSALGTETEKLALARQVQVSLNKMSYYRRLLKDIERILEDV